MLKYFMNREKRTQAKRMIVILALRISTMCGLGGVILFGAACSDSHSVVSDDIVFVRDRDTEEPIAGAKVVLYRNNGSSSPFAINRTNEKGRVVFHALTNSLAKGEVWYTVVSADGYEATTMTGTGFMNRPYTVPLDRVHSE
jgi:hypothetical protein